MRILFYLVLVALGMSVPAWSDIVVSEGGESFTGSVVRINDGILVFRTELAGQMMMPMDTVQSLQTDRSMAVSLQDGSVLYGSFGGDSTQPLIEPVQAEAEDIPFNLADVVEALPVPKTTEPEGMPSPRLRGSAEIGLRGTTGNTNNLAPAGRLDLGLRGERFELDSSFLLEGDDSGDFPQAARASAEVRSTRPTGLVPFGAAELARDQYNALDLRAQLTLGLQRDLLDSETASFRALLGLGYAYEDWDLGYLARVEGNPFDRNASDGTTDEVNLPLGLRYSRALFGEGRFNSALTVYPSLTNAGEIRARSLSTVAYPVSDRLQLRLNLELEYDSDRPYTGLDELSTSVGAGLGVDF